MAEPKFKPGDRVAFQSLITIREIAAARIQWAGAGVFLRTLTGTVYERQAGPPGHGWFLLVGITLKGGQMVAVPVPEDSCERAATEDTTL